jgi:hypothetical protein
MRSLQKLIWLIVISSCALSCERTIEVTLPAHEPRLVLHGYVMTGEKFHVAINQTVRANFTLSGDETYVTNAWVLLFEDNRFVDSLKYDAQLKRYRSQNVLAVAGKTYKVVAGADGFTSIEATATASSPVNTISVLHDRKVRSNSNGDLLDDILFSFNDPANEKNFYLVSLYPNSWTQLWLSCIYSNDPAVDRIRGELLPFDEGSCLDSDHIIFSDKSFNGSLKQVSLSGVSYTLESATDSSGNLRRPYIRRSHISEEHYQYLKSTLSLLAGGVVPSLNDPVAIKGNVKNGYGLFDVFSVTTDTLR